MESSIATQPIDNPGRICTIRIDNAEQIYYLFLQKQTGSNPGPGMGWRVVAVASCSTPAPPTSAVPARAPTAAAHAASTATAEAGEALADMVCRGLGKRKEAGG